VSGDKALSTIKCPGLLWGSKPNQAEYSSFLQSRL
jgi:hypothetical protein